mgnify:CR=1 FL=1
MYDVITIGSATVDVFADTKSQLVKFVTPQGEQDLIAYPSGSKILISGLSFLVGGGGTNTAVSFARLGLRAAFGGKIGDDENGYRVLHLLTDEGVDFVGSKEGQTGYSIVLDSIEHDGTIFTYKDANNTMAEHELPQAKSLWLYLSSMMETSFASAAVFATRLKESGARIAFNPSNYQAKLGLARLQPILKLTDVLVLNKEEAKLLLGKQGSPAELATLLSHHQPRYVVVTDGPRGATCYFNKSVYHIAPTPNLTVRESTGAGDAFASAFVAGLHKGLDITQALTLGMVQAESVIQAPGAKTNLLHYDDARVRMEHFAGRIHKSPAPESLDTVLDTLPQQTESAANPFYFSNGKELTTLEELAYYLRFVKEETFRKHVHDSTNDFALWIEHSLHLDDLARQVRTIDNQFTMSKLIMEYIHR